MATGKTRARAKPTWTIRRAEPGDAEGLRALYAAPDVYSNTLQLPLPSQEQWRKNLADWAGNTLVAVAGGELIGHCGLHGNTRPRNQHVAFIGLSVVPAWQRRGVGTSLMKSMLDLADNWLGILRLELQVYTDNHRAIALYQKFGFEIEGTLRSNVLRQGQYVDSHLMARLHPMPPSVGQTASIIL